MANKSRQRVRPDTLPEQRGTSDVLTVLLAEYASRQDEKNIAAQGLLSVLGIAFATIAGLVALIIDHGAPGLWLIAPPLLLTFLVVELHREFSVLYSAVYISMLEKRINRIARGELLQWEHQWTIYHRYIKPRRLLDEHGERKLNLGRILGVILAGALAAFFAL